ncbi:MAG: histidinol-phosphate transaminase [Gemmatimonadota bacterium]|nr:histidinol-phosphate transaminase [Gemmatimonadota bacterium]
MKPWIEEIEERYTRGKHGGPGPGGPAPGVVDFSVNVNPFGPPPAAAEAWKRADPVGYPDPASLEACRAAADAWGLPLEAVRFGAGATEFLHRAALAWLRPDATAVIGTPCFAEYARAITLARGRVVSVPPADSTGTLDLRGVAEEARSRAAAVVYLGRPNTPTGEAIGRGALLELRRALPTGSLLVLDESFLSFEAGSLSAPPVLGVHDGVLTVRSITKDCGLAGLRAGFAVGPERVIRALDRVALPWSASAPAQEAARASFAPESIAYLDGTFERIRNERIRLEEALRAAGLTPRPSSANFVCARTPWAEHLAEELEHHGLRVRRCASFGLTDHLRVGVRHPSENGRLISALEELACA